MSRPRQGKNEVAVLTRTPMVGRKENPPGGSDANRGTDKSHGVLATNNGGIRIPKVPC